ncbi:MAG: hypothetical protein M2R45_05141 [Verrucomicrobia subdivision 3 bacterium]|nr:hypothetical protein [Limisphaerales bacterium]MCS1417203.1 hypothetical protein [Limisphaerales bacterium]
MLLLAFRQDKAEFLQGDTTYRWALAIVLTDKALKSFREAEPKAPEVLLHEKLHVIQHLIPHRFETAFKRYGYELIEILPNADHTLNLIGNPDAPV